MKALVAPAVVLLFLRVAALADDKVDGFVRAQMEEHQIPGVALAIVREGHETRTASYGLANIELKVPARPETVFEIGSITKQFTAACVLLLAEDGRLSVEDKISRHLTNVPSAWSNITIRHLLTHTSGIKNYTGQSGFELARRLTQAQFIQALAALPVDFAPGEQAKYCNSGYNLLGFIIENVSGKRYWDFLGERILSPLGMPATTNRDPALIVVNRADGYVRENGRLRNRDSDLTDVFSAGAIVSTVRDLIKWNTALDKGEVLSAASRQQMWTAGILNDGTRCSYGFGWKVGDIEGRKAIGHSGSTSGFSASLQRFPDDKLAVIVLCNSDEPNIATTLARTIASFYF